MDGLEADRGGNSGGRGWDLSPFRRWSLRRPRELQLCRTCTVACRERISAALSPQIHTLGFLISTVVLGYDVAFPPEPGSGPRMDHAPVLWDALIPVSPASSLCRGTPAQHGRQSPLSSLSLLPWVFFFPLLMCLSCQSRNATVIPSEMNSAQLATVPDSHALHETESGNDLANSSTQASDLCKVTPMRHGEFKGS